MKILHNIMRIWHLEGHKKEENAEKAEQIKVLEYFDLDKEIENDLENMQRRIEISKLLFMEKYEAAQNKLNRLKEYVYKTGGINGQYIIFTEAVIQYSLGKISKDMYQSELLRAIHLSKPDYKISKRMKGLLTRQETLIIINIALYYRQEEKKDTALRILYQLEEYYRKNRINFEQNGAVLVWLNLSHLLEEMGYYEEGIRVAKEGIDLELKCTKGFFVKKLLSNMGKNIKHLDKGKRKLLKMYDINNQMEREAEKQAILERLEINANHIYELL